MMHLSKILQQIKFKSQVVVSFFLNNRLASCKTNLNVEQVYKSNFGIVFVGLLFINLCSVGQVNSFPYTENFDPSADATTSFSPSTTGSFALYTTNGHSSGSDYCARLSNIASSDGWVWINFTGIANYTYIVSGWATRTQTINVYIGTTNTVAYMTSSGSNIFSANTGYTGSGYSQFTSSSWTCPANGNYYVAYRANCYSTYSMLIDDINITQTAPVCTTPTTQANSITFASINCSQMTVNFSGGNGSKRVVKMNTSNSFTAPTDGTDPTANTVYGGSGEQVIYNNNGGSVTVTGLSPSTTYYYRVYEYNCTGTSTKYISTTSGTNPANQATSAPTTATASNNGPVNIGAQLDLTGGPGSMTTYAWSGPNAYSNSSQSPTVSASATGLMAGIYTLTITNTNGCTSTATTTVTINCTSPTISSQPSNGAQSVCKNASATALSVTAAAGSGTISSYEWYSNSSPSNSGGTLIATNSTSSTTNTYTPLTSTVGVLYYYVVITNSNGCSTTSNVSGAITINSLPTATASNNSPVNTGTTLTLTGGPSSMTTYAWAGPNSYTSASQSPTVSASATSAMGGTYTITVTNPNGCSSTATTSVTIITGNTYYVNDNSTSGDAFCSAVGNNSNNGTSAATPKLTLKNLWTTYGPSGTNVLTSGDLIKIDAGTYSATGFASVDEGNFDISVAGLTFLGAGYTKTIFDHNHHGTASTEYFMYIKANNVTLKDFTVREFDNVGTATPGHSGQAITVGNSATGVLIENIVVQENGASGGNAAIVVLANTSTTIKGGGGYCNVWKTSYTGGVEAYGNGITLNIQDYLLGYNFKSGSYDGGGLLINNANNTTTVNVTNTKFYSNESSDGGAISQRGGVLNVTDCIIDANAVGQVSTVIYGAGARISGGTATFTRTKFTNNVIASSGGTLKGGGIAAYSLDNNVSLTLEECSFSGNVASNGNDLFAAKSFSNSVVITVNNTTFSSTAANTIYNQDATITISNSGDPGVSGANSPALSKTNTIAPSSIPNPSTPNITGTCATAIVLPIEINKFSGLCMKDKIRLTWETVSEQNNDNFEIERSEDAFHFYYVGKINGNGTTNSLHNYSFYEFDTDIGKTYYYRLKQNDYNGNYSYSEIIKVEANCSEDNNEIIVYPNPSQSNFNLEIPINKLTKILVEVYNELGQLVKFVAEQTTEESGVYKVMLEMNEFSTGVYFIKTYINSKPTVTRIIKF